MTEELTPPVDRRHSTETLSRVETEKLIRRVDDLYFGGSEETREPELPQKSDTESQ